MASATSLARADNGPDEPANILKDAINAFESALPQAERAKLRQMNTVPDADAVMVFTAELDAANRSRRGRSIATRLHSVLQSVRDFSAVIDTFVSSHPEVAALVWGSIKLTMLLVSNYVSYFEELSTLFMRFREQYPKFEEYQALFPTYKPLQKAICNFHASIIRCCKHAVQTIQRPWQNQLLNAFRQSFEKEFEPDRLDIQSRSKDVKEQIQLAKAKADHRFQEIQTMQQEDSKKGLHSLLSATQTTSDELKEMRLQHYRLRERDRRQKLLLSLSSHAYSRPYREACRKRHKGTAEWIFTTPEFELWQSQHEPMVLLCTGKIGSGKTVLTASAIAHIARLKKSNEHITYLFVCHDDPGSLKAEAVIRSVIRQALDPTTMSKTIVASLRALERDDFSELEKLKLLLQEIVRLSDSFYIFVDGIDECETSERRILLDALSWLITNTSGLRLFLSGRESLLQDLRGKFGRVERMSTASPHASPDIVTYVEESVEDRRQAGEFDVRDPSLLQEVKQRLSQHADGMFLWVAYLIDEICHQTSDEDIRKSLDTLPKNLEETFERALSRIKIKGNSRTAEKVFPWVAVAERRLTLEEIAEAVSLDIGQRSSNIDGRLNNTSQVISRTENLLQLDEEYQTISFAHKSILEFIVGGCSTGHFANMHVNIKEADHLAGEKCMTYLHFSDFQTTLARRQQGVRVAPVDIAGATFGRHKMMSKFAKKVVDHQLRGNKTNSTHELRGLESFGRASRDQSLPLMLESHPFLAYAAEHWASHTKLFREGVSVTWQLWQRTVTCGHGLVQNPWGSREFPFSRSDMISWARDTHHLALLQLLHDAGMLMHRERLEITSQSIKEGDLEMTKVLLSLFSRLSPRDVVRAFVETCENGHIEIFDNILAACPLFESLEELGHGLISGLEAASRGGHLAIVERLLIACDLAAPKSQGGNDGLRAACEGGYIEIVERLLAAGAGVNAGSGKHAPFRTPLYEACAGGYPDIVRLLLHAGADVNSGLQSHGLSLTPLVAACEGGYIDIVHDLIKAKARVDPLPTTTNAWYRCTALQAACEGGYIDIVQELIKAKAEVNASPGREHQRTALQAACQGGHMDIVEELIKAKAEINARPAKKKGRTALQAACEGGHIDIAVRLLAMNADVNAEGSAEDGVNCLQAASKHGHLDLVRLLIAAGAKVGALALEFACASGHYPLVQELLAEPPKPMVLFSSTKALELAASSGRLDIVELLLPDSYADSDMPEFYFGPALMSASAEGHITIVRQLLSAGASVHEMARDDYNHSALAVAVEHGHGEIVRLFLAKYSDQLKIPPSAIVAASEGGYIDVIKQLLAKGASAKDRDQHGRTALMCASQQGHLQVVELLLEMRVSVHHTFLATEEFCRQKHSTAILLGRLLWANESNGLLEGRSHSALSLASANGHLEVVERLLPSRPRLYTALLVAMATKNYEVTERLLAAGAIHEVKSPGTEALVLAAVEGDLRMVELLLAANANVNPSYKNDFLKPLWFASQNGHLDVMERLLAAGADCRASCGGRTVMEAALTAKDPEIGERLKKALGE